MVIERTACRRRVEGTQHAVTIAIAFWTRNTCRAPSGHKKAPFGSIERGTGTEATNQRRNREPVANISPAFAPETARSKHTHRPPPANTFYDTGATAAAVITVRTTKHFFLVEGRRVKVKRLCKKSPDIPTQKEPSFDFDSYYIKGS